jgi:hypothetical protein
MMKSNSDPIFTLFCLLSELRKSKSIRHLQRRLHQRQERLFSRIDYYIRLCQASQLLTTDPLPQPTILCERFFSWDRKRQYELLLKQLGDNDP